MTPEIVASPSPKVTFILAKEHVHQALATRVRKQFPHAKIFVDLDQTASSLGLAGLFFRLERWVLRYPGHIATPVNVEPLSDPFPASDIVVDLRRGVQDRTHLLETCQNLWWLQEFDMGGIVDGKSAVTVTLLGQSSEQEDPHLIAQACIQGKVLVQRTQDFATEKALQLIRRELARCALTHEASDLGPAPAPPEPIQASHLFGYTARVLYRLLSEVRTKLLRKFEAGQVFALSIGSGEPGQFSPQLGTRVPHPRQGWYADPFLIAHDGSQYCFFEDLGRGANAASISVAKLQGDKLGVPSTALKAEYHMSFPFVFEHGGDIYMLPETIGANRIEIWKADAFPHSWTLHATALEGQHFADPVLVQIEGQWWLFANPSNDSLGDFSSELWLFQVDGPDLRQLEPHPLNPVVVGSDTARNGGRVLYSNGRLLRFSQDNSSNTYGYGLNIMEITTISKTDYHEKRIRHVCPNDIPNVIGCHHIDFLDGRFVMDIRLP